MLKNYIKIALRNLFRNKTFSAINILGLALGISSCILILLYVQYEFSFDSFNKNCKNIYRAASNVYVPGKNIAIASTSDKLGPALKENFQEVKNYVRIFDIGRLFRQVVRYQDKTHNTSRLMFVDSSFFTVFSYSLIEGNPHEVLSAPFSIVITKSTAIEYFGNEDPVGKMLQINQGDTSFNFTVTGIVADPSSNSSLQFDFLPSFSTLYTSWFKQHWAIDSWGSQCFYTYVLLADNQPVEKFEAKCLPFFRQQLKEAEEQTGNLRASIFFQHLKDIHIYSHLDFDLPSNINVQSLYILSAIAFFLLLIACVNFMNLSTAKYVKRSKEISVRKVLGAERSQLIRQFLGETIIISSIATGVGVMMVEVFLPYTKSLYGTLLSLSVLNNVIILLVLAGIAVFTGLLAGVYPALFLSSLDTITIFKKTIKSASLGNIVRKSLVAFQFTISIVLIVSAIVVQKQLSYVQNSNLGFNKSNLVVIPFNNQSGNGHGVNPLTVYRTELERQSNIIMTTAASDYPGYMVRSTNFKATGKNTEQIMMNVVYVDSNYLKTLDLHLKSGTSFLEAHTPNAIIINESAVRKFGFQNPIGQDLITSWGVKSKIVGVIKDFNFESLHNKVCPLILAEIPGQFNFLICRINDRDISSTLKFISEKWQKIYPGIPFDYSFLDAELGRLYIKDERLSDAVNIFTGLAMVIACLGLFGLASFSVEERTKEIGIRKVLGASVVSVVGLLSKEFLKLVLLANLIAWPLAYYFMTGWLNNFAYRTDITGWVFLTAGGIALFVALATISAHSIKAATANPVKSLKYE